MVAAAHASSSTRESMAIVALNTPSHRHPRGSCWGGAGTAVAAAATASATSTTTTCAWGGCAAASAAAPPAPWPCARWQTAVREGKGLPAPRCPWCARGCDGGGRAGDQRVGARLLAPPTPTPHACCCCLCCCRRWWAQALRGWWRRGSCCARGTGCRCWSGGRAWAGCGPTPPSQRQTRWGRTQVCVCVGGGGGLLSSMCSGQRVGTRVSARTPSPRVPSPHLPPPHTHTSARPCSARSRAHQHVRRAAHQPAERGDGLLGLSF